MTLEGFTGLNFNADPQSLDPRMLPDTGAKYVRALLDVIPIRHTFDETHMAGNPITVIDPATWETMKDSSTSGTAKMILSLQWDFKTAGSHPPLPGSERERLLFRFLDHQILNPIAPSLAIIVSGNEPFVNTSDLDWLPRTAFGGIPMVVFYQRVTEHINDYLIRHRLRSQVKLFVGAFTRLDNPGMQHQQAAIQLLDFAEHAPYVDGVDIHLHVKATEDMVTALSFAQSRTKKPFLVTEYTPVYAAQAALKMGLPLGETFGEKWNLPSTIAELDFLRCNVFHIGNGCRVLPKISSTEWQDFIATRPWYVDHFLLTADAIFRRFPVVGATFGAVQHRPGSSQLDPTGIPWYLGFVYSPISSGYQDDGMPYPNYQYIDDFRQLTGATD